MYRRVQLPPSLVRCAANSEGILTRQDLLRSGLSPEVIRRLRRGWTPIATGIYALPGSYDPWRQRLTGALRVGGDGAAAFGETALALWGMIDPPDIIDVLTVKRGTPAMSGIRFHRGDRNLRRIARANPPRTSIEDAVIDAADRTTADDALSLVARALQERRTTPARLTAAIDARRRLAHRRLLRTAISDSAAGAHSAFEHRYLADVERAHAVPPMTRQYLVPETKHPADGAYPNELLLIELDGVRYHDRERDRALDNQHSAAGYRTLRFTWAQLVSRPCAIAAEVTAALGTTIGRRCPRC